MTLLRPFIFASLSTLSISTVASESAPSVIERYPACEYQVLDTIEASDLVNFEKVSTSAAEMAQSVALLIEDIKHQAQSVGASKIAIINKNLRPTRNQNGRLSVSAELIGECKSSAAGQGELTPYNAQGLKQSALSLGTITIGKAHTITIDTNQDTFVETELGDNRTISIDEGIYGLPLGATIQQMIDKFGTPTFEFALSADSRLFAYGRDHWFTFVNDALVKVSNSTERFTATFINYLPFDDRFDDRDWQVADTLVKSALLSPEAFNAHTSRYSSAAATLEVKTEQYTNRDNKKQVKVTGFELVKKGVTVPDDLPDAATQNEVLRFLSRQLNENGSDIKVTDIPHTDLGRTRKTRDGQYHLFNAYTLVEFVGKAISEIQINPNFMTAVTAEKKDWQFGNFYYGQSEQDALAAAGDMAFYFDHILEYEGDDYTAKVYLERQDGEYRVYNMEVSIY